MANGIDEPQPVQPIVEPEGPELLAEKYRLKVSLINVKGKDGDQTGLLHKGDILDREEIARLLKEGMILFGHIEAVEGSDLFIPPEETESQQ